MVFQTNLHAVKNPIDDPDKPRDPADSITNDTLGS
jgi:hypothetical protein